MKLNKSNAGLKVEKIAETFLLKQGLKLIASNYHCPFGEIDLIMQDGQTLAFIEVRLRTNAKFGSAAASITPQKQQKLINTAQHFLQKYPTKGACRFDAVLFNQANSENLDWIRNAFDT